MPFLYGCVTIQKCASEIIEFIKHKDVIMTFFQEFHLKSFQGTILKALLLALKVIVTYLK